MVNFVKEISPSKALSRDAVTLDSYKHGGLKHLKKLHDLFINIWKVGIVPQDFKDVSLQHNYKNKKIS